MSLLPRIKSIFFIVDFFNKMKYELKNKIVLEVLKKLIITRINLLVYYLIIKINYAKLLLIIELIFISNEFENARD